MALGGGFLLVSPLILLSWLEAGIRGAGSERLFGIGKEILALIPTPIGAYLRLAYYVATCRAISPDACFLIGSMLAHRDVAVGAGSVIGAFSLVGRAEIGQRVLVAARASIVSGPYLHGRPGQRVQGGAVVEHAARVRIGNDCWIGENAVVMADLGPRCSVAAGAVVARPGAAGATLMGNPARRVDLRSEDAVPSSTVSRRQTTH